MDLIQPAQLPLDLTTGGGRPDVCRSSSPRQGICRRITSCTAIALLAELLFTSVCQSAEILPVEAKRCVEEARELLNRNKFLDASEKYLCAARESEKHRGTERKALEYRANAYLYRSWGLYAKTKVSGMFGKADLDYAVQLAEQARNLWRQAQNAFGEEAAEGWRLYLEGIQYALAYRYKEATQQFGKARRIFLELEQQQPGVRETTQPLVRLAEEQAIFSDLMDLWNSEDYEIRLGEMNRRLAELEEGASPGERPLYQGLAGLSRAEGRLKDGSDRLVGWNYSDAIALLSEAEKALMEARAHFSAVKEVALRQPLQYIYLVDGWASVTRAEQHHAKALEALLARGDVGRAKGEFIESVQSYGAAQTAFEKAFFSAQAIGAIRNSSKRLRERAQVVASAFGPTQAMLNVGRFFLAIFFGTLGVMTSLMSRLRLAGRTVVWIALVVGIIGAFGLRAPDILNALKSLPKVGG